MRITNETKNSRTPVIALHSLVNKMRLAEIFYDGSISNLCGGVKFYVYLIIS